MSVHMSFEKVSSNKSACAVRKSAMIRLLRVMVQLMPISVIYVRMYPAKSQEAKTYKCSALE
jgi:spore maturation protein SpmA